MWEEKRARLGQQVVERYSRGLPILQFDLGSPQSIEHGGKQPPQGIRRITGIDLHILRVCFLCDRILAGSCLLRGKWGQEPDHLGMVAPRLADSARLNRASTEYGLSVCSLSKRAKTRSASAGFSASIKLHPHSASRLSGFAPAFVRFSRACSSPIRRSYSPDASLCRPDLLSSRASKTGQRGCARARIAIRNASVRLERGVRLVAVLKHPSLGERHLRRRGVARCQLKCFTEGGCGLNRSAKLGQSPSQSAVGSCLESPCGRVNRCEGRRRRITRRRFRIARAD